MKPRKKRDVLYPPGAVYFKPQGIPMPYLNIVNLTIDEYESVRLGDLENLKHEAAAKQMNISRPTFTRLLRSAHSKISDAIVNGKAIKIEGGDYKLLGNRFRCRKCGSFWNAGEENKSEAKCLNCNSTEVDNVGEKLNSNLIPGKRCRHGHDLG
jgi:Predicted DNA-binding proteins